MKANEIIKTYGTDYTAMTLRLLSEAGLANHICEKTAKKTNPRIGIKPNLVTPSPAMFGATTHPEIIEGIILYLKKHGFSNLAICEGSWVGDKTSDAFEYCGYHTLADQYHVELIDTQKDSAFPAACPVERTSLSGKTDSLKTFAGCSAIRRRTDNITQLHICSCLKDIDFLINVPVLKGHCQTKVTCALKNMKGLIPNSEKRRFHKLGLHRPIADLNTVIHQDFIVVDHICGDPDFEEGGNPLITNCIMAALDPVLVDAYACQILHYRPEDVEYIRLAALSGVGNMNLNQAVIRQIGKDENVPSDQSIDYTAHKALQLNYATTEIESCSACYSALTEALQRFSEEGLLHKLTDELHMTFHIGQGYRGMCAGAQSTEPETARNMPIGIGQCTCHFAKNIPGCPPAGDDIYRYLKQFV